MMAIGEEVIYLVHKSSVQVQDDAFHCTKFRLSSYLLSARLRHMHFMNGWHYGWFLHIINHLQKRNSILMTF